MPRVLIESPATEWPAGENVTIRLSPLTLPTGRAVGDYDAFFLGVRVDPHWPRSGSRKVAREKGTVDPIAEGWALVDGSPVTGTVVSGVPTFSFEAPSDAGLERYVWDAWATIDGGEVRLVKCRWLTIAARAVPEQS